MERGLLITQQLFNKDLFSKWLGIEIISAGDGTCKLKMTVREEMCNGFGIAHGGIAYALADSGLAFASNSRGRHALSIETSISHFRPLKPADEIIAEVKELHLSFRTGVYEVILTTSRGEVVAVFKGTVFRKDVEWKTD
ncbi:MAG TPA: hotdog fold thioesterase [Flavitalea sp.]|nr:hotdog fold thioesterase [Flavitalea sp.]